MAAGLTARRCFEPFPSSDDPTSGQQKQWVPPISMMSIIDYTHVQNPVAAGTAPSAPFATNDNVSLNTLSFFYGGAITDHIGMFQQVTYNATPGAFAWHWDNTDVRATNTANIGTLNVIYGITANNNPTLQIPGIPHRRGLSPTSARPSAPARGPNQSSTALSRNTSAASVVMSISTTWFISKVRSIAHSIQPP